MPRLERVLTANEYGELEPHGLLGQYPEWFVTLFAGVELIRGWDHIAQALQVSQRTAMRMAATGEIVVRRGRPTGNGRGGGRCAVWTTAAEVLEAFRKRLGLEGDGEGRAKTPAEV